MAIISVRHNFNEVAARLEANVSKQVNYAASVALNETAKRIQAGLQAAMKSKFDAPTNWTLRNVRIIYATKNNLQAVVYLGNKLYSGASLDPSEILGHHFSGGSRRAKNLERYLAKKIGKTYFAPGAGARLDRYGNMSRGQVAQIISQAKLGLDPASWKTNSKRSKASRKKAGRIFALSSRDATKHLGPGVWIDMGAPIGVRPLLVPIAKPTYRKRFDLPLIASKVIKRSFNQSFRAALAKAKSTAR